jgi:hypothetical protein
MNGAITPQPASPQEHLHTATRLPASSGMSGEPAPRILAGSNPRQSFATRSKGFLPLTRILRTGQSGLPSRTSNPG